MRMEERLAALEYENRKLRADNEKLSCHPETDADHAEPADQLLYC